MEKLAIRLRELEPADVPVLNHWRNDPEVIEQLGNNFFFIAETVDEAWYAHYLQHRHQAVRLAITMKESGDYIGNVNLTSLHTINRSAEFSIMIGVKTYWGKGAGTEATRQMLQHGFSNMGLHRIWLTVLAGNERARRLYTSLGFREEGVKRQAIFKNGRFEDEVIMAILAEEWKG